jgi:hypothetical protein
MLPIINRLSSKNMIQEYSEKTKDIIKYKKETDLPNATIADIFKVRPQWVGHIVLRARKRGEL